MELKSTPISLNKDDFLNLLVKTPTRGRQQLKEYPFVSHFEDEHVERGGAGVTVVSLA